MWGSAFQGKYLDRIETFIRQAYTSDYTNKIILLSNIIKIRDSALFNRTTSNNGRVMYHLLPLKRNRARRDAGHDFMLPRLNTEQFKHPFATRCLLRFIS